MITRKYAYDANLFDDGLDDGIFDDERLKTYEFFVDRIAPIQNVVVDYPLDGTGVGAVPPVFERTIGEYIKLMLGIDHASEDVQRTFDSFLYAQQDTTPILYTDLMPIKPYIPTNKYSVRENTPLHTYTELASFNLTFKLFRLQSDAVTFTEIFSTNAVQGGYLNIDFKKLLTPGTYKIQLTDNAGYDKFNEDGTISDENKNKGANTSSFVIRIEKEAPVGTYVVSQDGTQSTERPIYNAGDSSNVPSTSDKHIKFVFEDSVNPYKSKIDCYDVVVKSKGKNDKIGRASCRERV